MARQARLRSTPLDAANLHANATQRRAVEGHLGGFCVWQDMRKETAPARSACRGPLVSELRRDGASGDGSRPTDVLALRYELGRLHSLGLLQTLILSLRIADGLGQHLA